MLDSICQVFTDPQRMTSFLKEITGKSKRNQEISYAKIARCRPLDIDSDCHAVPSVTLDTS